MRIKLRTWIALGVIAILLPIVAFNFWKKQTAKAAWFDENWLYRKQLTIDDAQVSGSSNLSNFPVLVSSTHTELTTYAQADGDDIMFVDKDGNKLAHEIESFTSGTGALVAWVKIPTLFPTEDTVIYMYYGNPSATNQQSPQQVWDENYTSVHHLKEDPSVTAPQMLDSTAKNNDGTSNGTMTDTDQVAAKVNGGIDFDGTNDYINIPDASSLDINTTSTLEAWFKPDAVTSTEANFSSWTTISTGGATPAGQTSFSGDNMHTDSYDVAIAGEKTYHILAQGVGDGGDGDDEVSIAYSDLGGTNMSAWTTLTDPGLASGTRPPLSAAIDSDGSKIYFVYLAGSNATNTPVACGSADMNLANFSGWTDITNSNAIVTAQSTPSSIDMVIVGGKMYIVVFAHNGTTGYFKTASANLDCSGISAWTAQTVPTLATGIGTNDSTSVGIDSDGEKLYYVAYSNETGTSAQELDTSNSNLDGTSFAAWSAQTNLPNGTLEEKSMLDMAVAGGKMYLAHANGGDLTAEDFSTANVDLDGTDMTTWTSQAGHGVDVGNGEAGNTAVETDGKHIYYYYFGQNASVEELATISNDITSHPIISKSGAYELIQTSTGLVFDWAGKPISFGSALAAGTTYHVAITDDGTNLKFYINNSLKRTQTASLDLTSNSNAYKIGGDTSYFDGIIDEVRISNTARSTDWMTTSYSNMNDPSAFITAGSAETGPALALWLKYEEGMDNTCVGGEDACDSTTNANDGTFTGTSWQNESMCVTGKCVSLDGTDDVTTISNSTSIDFDSGLSTGVTFQTWIRVDSDGENNVGEIFDKGANTYMRVTSEGTDGFVDLEAKLDLGTTDATLTLTNGISLNTWHHVALVYTDDGDDEITVYIDGIARGTSTDGVGAPAGTDTNDLLIGGSSTANYDGFIDEFKVYQRERTAAEIKVDYTSGSAVLGSTNTGTLSNGLAGYWKMDQASGNATDSSGNGTTLTDTNTVAAVYGRFSAGGNFASASSEYQYAADNAYLSLTGDITLAAWIKPASNTADTQFDIIGKWDGTNESYLLSQFGDEIRMYIDSASNYVTTDSVNLQTSTWYQVTGVYNTKLQTVTIYINGSPVAATTTGTIPASIGDDAGRFHLGAEDSTTSAANFYNGVIDEARVYKRILSADEVYSLYDWRPGPEAHWKLDENGGAIVIDSSGNDHDGAFVAETNTPTWTTGKFGSAMKFDGSNDYFQVTSLNGKIYRAFSYSVWYKSAVTTVADEHNIFNNFDTADNLTFGPTDDASHVDQLRYVERYNTGTNNFIYGTTDVVDGNWHHLVLTRSDTTIKMYVDGKEDYSGNDPVPNQAITINTIFESGYGPESGIDAVNGWTDDIRIYDYALTPEQVVQVMNVEHPVGGSPISTAVGHWKFDEGADNTCSGGTNDVCNTGSVGTTLDGTSTADRYSAGKLNKALDFNGSDDVVTITNSSAIDFDNNLNDGFTFSTWINPDGAGEGNGGQIFYKGTNTWLRVDTLSGGRLDLQASLDLATTDATLNVSSAVPTGSWSHVALSYTDDDDDEITIWVNGIALGTSTDGVGAPAATDTNNLLIGGTTTDNFDGKMDEFKVYAKELSKSEMAIDNNLGASLGVSTGVTEASGLTGGAGNGPSGYWPMDENTGTAVNDISGNGYNAAFESSVGMSNTNWTRGKYGSAIKLDNSNDRVVSGDYLNFGDTDDFTISLWFYKETSANTDSILSKKTSTAAGNAGYEIYFSSSTSQINFIASDGTDQFELDNVFPSTGTWHQMVIVYDQDSTANTDIYLDGVKQGATQTGTLANIGAITNASNLTFGAEAGTNDTNYLGSIDEVKIYTYALTPAQIAYDYNRGKPLAHWKFDECQGTSANDSSGNSLTGTITPGASGNTTAGTCGSGTSTEMWNDGTTGKYNGSLGFDGSNDTVNVGDVAGLSFERTNPFSISAWFKTTNTGAQTLISKQDSSAPYSGWNVQLGGSSYIYFQLVNNYGSNLAVEVRSTTTQSYDDNNWHHLAISYTGSGVASGVSMYLDGRSLPTTATIDGLGSNSIDNTIAVHIGSRNGSAQVFNGQIDDVRVYNYALSDTQTKTIMNNDAAVRFGPATGTP